MGEAKRRRERTPQERALEELSRRLADDGKIIEAGWASLCALAIPPDAPPVQINEMRRAYMAGAQHLWATVLTILEPGSEPTAKDLARMDLISRELDTFAAELEAAAAGRKQ